MHALAALRPAPRHLIWFPAALLCAAGALSAIGVPLTPNGQAATSTGSSVISASVLPEVSLDLGQNALGAATCSAGTGTISGPANAEVAQFGVDTTAGRLAINMSGVTNLGSCSMTFGTNNGASGASLSVKSARASGALFCQNANATACTGTAYTDEDGLNNVLEADKFGIRADTLTCTTPTWTAGNYYGAPLAGAAGSNICTGQATNASAASDGVVVLSFHVNTSTRPSGNYYGQLDFTATAN